MSRLSCNIPLFSWYDTNPGTPSFSKSSINELVSAILTDITNTFQVGFFFNTSRIACDFPEPIGAVHNTVHFLCFCPLLVVVNVYGIFSCHSHLGRPRMFVGGDAVSLFTNEIAGQCLPIVKRLLFSRCGSDATSA